MAPTKCGMLLTHPWAPSGALSFSNRSSTDSHPGFRTMIDEDRIERARGFVRRLRGVYIHVAAYIVVNTFLIVVDLMTTPDLIWFYWPLLGWGIGLGAHVASIFIGDKFLGREWEERKMREFLKNDDI